MYTVTVEVPRKFEEDIVELLQDNSYNVRYRDNGYVVQRDDPDHTYEDR